MDIYGEFLQSYYDDMLALAGDKPIALAEVGAMPTLDMLANQPGWAYFMMWSGLAEGANSLEQLQTMFHSPNLLNRGDAPFAPPPAAGSAEVEPATPEVAPGVKEILTRLYASSGTRILSGQRNDSGSPDGATEQVFQVASKHTAIYESDLDTTSGADSARAVLDEAVRQSAAKSIVSLRWLAPNPAAPEIAGGRDSRETALTDFEWKELMTPGTHLYQRWCAQVDAAGARLKQLDDKGVAVLWTPYPQSNGMQYWWAGHAGIHGSAALYRMLFERLVHHDQVLNLVWVWEAAPPSFGPGPNGAFSEYFPGLLHVDALQLALSQTHARLRSDVSLAAFAVAKPIGLSINGPAPDPAFFARETDRTLTPFSYERKTIHLPSGEMCGNQSLVSSVMTCS
jgi:hypothetical protein